MTILFSGGEHTVRPPNVVHHGLYLSSGDGFISSQPLLGSALANHRTYRSEKLLRDGHPPQPALLFTVSSPPCLLEPGADMIHSGIMSGFV